MAGGRVKIKASHYQLITSQECYLINFGNSDATLLLNAQFSDVGTLMICNEKHEHSIL
jgi:hypothetical protein